jgi:hypothetical protein
MAVASKISVPIRVGWRTTFRGEDDQAVIIGQIHQWCDAALSALRARRRKEEQRYTCEWTSNDRCTRELLSNQASVSAELLDDLAIPVIQVSHESSSLFVYSK